MERLKPLLTWQHNVAGGPNLQNTEDAIRYGTVNFDNPDAIACLLKQRNGLRLAYESIDDDLHETLKTKAELAFKIQFNNDAIREVVKLHMEATLRPTLHNTSGYECPFCKHTYSDHTQFGDCPE